MALPDDLRQTAPDARDIEEALGGDRSGYTVCCPSVEELTSPRAGKRRDGSLAILYTDATFQQMFFERSCRPQTQAEVTRVERMLRRKFYCEQEYSHSYAVYDVQGSKVLDYIRIRSGCKCLVRRRSKRKRL